MRWGEVTVDMCPTCSGLLVGQAALARLLLQLATDLMSEVDLDTPWPAVPDSGGLAGCPRCGAPTEHDGYMGMRAVLIDRCGKCRGVWIDPSELGVMAIMYARNELRRTEAYEKSRAARKEQAHRFDLISLSNAVSSSLASHMLSFDPY
jgi:Zn-finger nucleic acid-binding protein